MMQVSSTAHMFHCRWYVRLILIHFNQKSDLRHDMEWLETHSFKAQQPEGVADYDIGGPDSSSAQSNVYYRLVRVNNLM